MLVLQTSDYLIKVVTETVAETWFLKFWITLWKIQALILLVCSGPEELSRVAAPPMGSRNVQTFRQWARLYWSTADRWYQVLAFYSLLDLWYHCPETTLRGINAFSSTPEQGVGAGRWWKRRCLLYSWFIKYDGNPNLSGEVFFGENSAGQTKWKCLELSAGEQLCLKNVDTVVLRILHMLRVFWMPAQILNAPKSNEN